jgi:hypothetical protein
MRSLKPVPLTFCHSGQPPLPTEGKPLDAFSQDFLVRRIHVQARGSAIQWPLDRVLIWLAKNGFSNDWQETFKSLELEGAEACAYAFLRLVPGQVPIFCHSGQPPLPTEGKPLDALYATESNAAAGKCVP